MVTPNEWMDILEKISREAVQQYEEIRALWVPCNMFDQRCVQEEAEFLGFEELASLTRSEYTLILKHYPELMRHYDVERL